jgi:flagellar hook-associated protein 2
MSSTISPTASSTSTTPTASSSSSSSSASSAAASQAVISSTGIGSGLDINAIVSTLTTAHGAAENSQLAQESSTLNTQISAFGTFSSALSTLQATLTPLETSSSLATLTATLGDPTIATATATADAVPAQYTLAVQNLAAAASLSSAPLSSATDSVGTGTLTIAVGTKSASIDIDDTDNSLQGIAAAINSAPNNPGVTATILTTTAGARLVISGNATGASNGITVTESGGDGGLAALVYDPATGTENLTETQAAADANFTINGYAATSPTNQVTGAISGVTLNLLKTTAPAAAATATTPATPAASTTLSIAQDSSAAATSIGTFVTALNGLLTSVQSLTGYDASTQTAGALQGNATLQAFQDQLENILDQVDSGNTSGISSLADLGITANTQGTYDSNSTTLGNALSGNLSGVVGLLGGSNGIATELNTLINQYVEPGGLLSTINQGLQTGLQNVATQQTSLNAQLATYSATLTAEYNAMDTAVALLKQTQTYLTAEFDPTSSSTSTSTNSSLGSGTLST